MLALPWRAVDVNALEFAGRKVVLIEGCDANGELDSVGNVLWDGSAHLARWLCANAEVVRGRDVLELGAGVGLVAIVAAFLGTPSRVVATDLPHVVPLLQRNVDANDVRVECVPLDWDKVDAAAVPGDAERVVLAADCVYSPGLAALFARALSACLGIGDAYVASKVRSTSLLRSMEEHWAQCGLCSCVVDGDVTTSDFVVHRVWRRP